MSGFIERLRKGYGKKLVSLHAWNGWIVVILTLTGLILVGGFWRGFLGEGRVWIKWLHIVVGIASILPVLYYLALAGKHWKQLKQKPWQRFNVLVVLGLLLGWFGSGVLLWQFKAVGPSVSNIALVVHDLLTWIGLPYIIYHSITRAKWLKEPSRRTIQSERETVDVHPAGVPQPIYTRRAFIRGAIGVGLAVTLGPSFMKWLGNSIGSVGGTQTIDKLIENDANMLVPAPQPLPASAPPMGGGAIGQFRVYTVTPIPEFSNDNWSFTIDGLVENSFKWDWKQFVELKRTVQVSDFHCVTGWSVYKNTWEGIPLKELLKKAGVKPGAQTVKLYSGDGVYTDTLTLEQADMDDVMVAVMHDGKPIPSDLGGPVRLVVPKMYAYKSVKWLNRIELIEGEHIGYWEQRGYANDAWV
ncbi:molybdopterin-dependent oxidoreductase [Paenibacillus prosopidis]|uniref:DMSO/TMAO reductase YedYZ molybdopterin-dependent catalytic subunit n=1 Tax=Paenibacillus prosopidis TaxID=630520 RepID=A0A368W6T0_9BACL|nr:molybdopterin-dependent oxidoreductase [Paenibacillus prosopidis]RCW51690.1 DMSO/TMAO reductase YedYZ molybdopterin-dependent catalytic subunit [Paenibacillus prosopidis]